MPNGRDADRGRSAASRMTLAIRRQTRSSDEEVRFRRRTALRLSVACDPLWLDWRRAAEARPGPFVWARWQGQCLHPEKRVREDRAAIRPLASSVHGSRHSGPEVAGQSAAQNSATAGQLCRLPGRLGQLGLPVGLPDRPTGPPRGPWLAVRRPKQRSMHHRSTDERTRAQRDTLAAKIEAIEDCDRIVASCSPLMRLEAYHAIVSCGTLIETNPTVCLGRWWSRDLAHGSQRQAMNRLSILGHTPVRSLAHDGIVCHCMVGSRRAVPSCSNFERSVSNDPQSRTL